MISISCY